MSSVADRLLAGEQVVYASGKHWIAPVRDSPVPVALILGGLLLSVVLPADDGLLGALWTLLGLVRWGLLAAGVAWIASSLLAWRTAEYAVTSLRVLRYEGLVRRRSSEVMLAAVGDVKLDVGMLGRQLGFGDLRIYPKTGAADPDTFEAIVRPDEFRNAMMSVKVELASARSMVAVARPADQAVQAQPVLQAPQRPAPVILAPVIPESPTPTPAPPGRSTTAAEVQASRLLRLAELRDRGVITPEEFEAKKAEILARF